MDVRSFGANLMDAARQVGMRPHDEAAEDAYYRRHAGKGLLLRGIQSAMVAVLAVVGIGWMLD
jgi:hypothetical protein